MKLDNAERRLNGANPQVKMWSELRKHLLWFVFAWLVIAVFSDTDQMADWMAGHHLCDVIGHKATIRVHGSMKWDNALGKFYVFKTHIFNETSQDRTILGTTRCVPEGGYAPINATWLETANYLTTRLFIWNHTPIVCLACMLSFVACFLALKSADATKRVFLGEKIESTLVLKAIREGEDIKGKKSDYTSKDGKIHNEGSKPLSSRKPKALSTTATLDNNEPMMAEAFSTFSIAAIQEVPKDKVIYNDYSDFFSPIDAVF